MMWFRVDPGPEPQPGCSDRCRVTGGAGSESCCRAKRPVRSLPLDSRTRSIVASRVSGDGEGVDMATSAARYQSVSIQSSSVVTRGILFVGRFSRMSAR